MCYQSSENIIKTRDQLIPAVTFSSPILRGKTTTFEQKNVNSPSQGHNRRIAKHIVVMIMGVVFQPSIFRGELLNFGGVIFLKFRYPLEIVIAVFNPHPQKNT